jgi:hypothetical protein
MSTEHELAGNSRNSDSEKSANDLSRSEAEHRKQTEWPHAAEMQSLQMIADGASLTDILNHVCTSIDLQIPPSITTVLLMHQDGKRLWPTAGPKVPHDIRR